jgi:effector-binding domain-containing protein
MPHFKQIEFDYANFPVLTKSNAYDTEWRQITLIGVLNLAQTEEYRSLRRKLSNSLYRIDPGIGYWSTEYDIVKIGLTNPDKYKEIRRRELNLVKYFPSDNIELGKGIVVIDIDFKNYKTLYLDQLNNYKRLIIEYFQDNSASVFLEESISGLGFHVGMSFHSETIDKKSYIKAYEFYTQEMAEKTSIKNFRAFVDFSVANIGADFFIGNSFIGLDGKMLFKNPTQSLHVETEDVEEFELTNEYSVDTFRADFLLQHYYSHIPDDSTAFSDYGTWINMTIALVVTFKNNKERAYFWFKKLSLLAEASKIDEEENDIIFERIFDAQYNAEIGINYIFKQIFEVGYAKNYINYSFEEVKKYFDENYHLLGVNDTPITNDYCEKYIIDQYISERSDELLVDRNILLIAPPNSGKSNFYLNKANVIILTPTSILRDDLWSNNQSTSKIVAEEEIVLDQITYIGNYDAIYKILNSELDLKYYTLVIDESHELFFSAHPNFRHKTVRKLVNSLSRFKNFVLLTGTPFQFELCEEKFETIYFTKTANRNPQLEIVSTLTPLETMAREILEAPGKQVCFINDKALISKVSNMINDKQPERNVIVFTSETKTEIEQQLALKSNRIPENTVVLGTQIILEGISFKDNDITHLRFYQPIIAEYIAQFSFRPRYDEKPPMMVMYTKPKDYRIQEHSSPLKAYHYLKKKFIEVLNSISQNGIENEPMGLIEEGNYRRLSTLGSGKKPELLPIILYQNIGYELDNLFLGQLATDLANRKSSIDLFSLLVQLQKWNFRFTFRQTESSEVLKLYTKKSKFKQSEIISEYFRDLVLQNNVSTEQYLLFRAWAFSKVINPSYFLSLSKDDRLSFFTDDKLFKSAALKVAVWSIENKLYNPYLSELVKILGLENLIQMVLVIKTKNTDQLISHELLLDWLGFPSSKIKDAKSKLKLYFDLYNVNKNGIRSIRINNADMSILDSIILDEFEQETNSPF